MVGEFVVVSMCDRIFLTLSSLRFLCFARVLYSMNPLYL